MVPTSAAAATTMFDNFEKYVRRQSLSRFLARYELFKLQLQVKGCIVECGVHHGGGLMAWAKLSAALEPFSLDRRIFGFDTFAGFPSVSDKDASPDNEQVRVGGFAAHADTHAELLDLIARYDENRVLNQYQKVFLVKGDAIETIPRFIADEPSLLVSLLFLDFDLYEPTKVALQHFLPRMSRGSVLAFDEVNNRWWPGETQAMLECLDLSKHELRRYPFDPNISYIVF
jgi:hypothetical protein